MAECVGEASPATVLEATPVFEDSPEQSRPAPRRLASQAPLTPFNGAAAAAAAAGSMEPTAHNGARAHGRSQSVVSESLASLPRAHAALLGTLRPQPTKAWRKRFVKLLIVGDSGLGKTTLIRALLSTPGERLDVHDGTSTPMAQFQKDPDSLITCVTWKNDADKEVWVYRVQDTPGYGDDTDIRTHIRMMLDHVRRQNTKWLSLEQSRDRGVDMSQVEDPRVDLCLYCLPPHRLRANDIRYMHSLGNAVPVVPIIMKADTMTIAEAQRYRMEVMARLENPQVSGVRGRINVFHFSREALERSSVPPSGLNTVPPFVVIASKDISKERLTDPLNPQYWPERAYKWGTAEAFNTAHSDLLYLRELLTAEALEEVMAAKRQRYEDWRAAELAVPPLVALRRRVLRAALSTVLPAACLAWAAVHGFDAQRMRDAAAAARRDAARRLRWRSGARPAAAAASPPPSAEPAPAHPPTQHKRSGLLGW